VVQPPLEPGGVYIHQCYHTDTVALALM